AARVNNGCSLLPDFRDFRQITGLSLKQVFQTQESAVHQDVGLFRRDAGNGSDGFDRLSHFFLEAHRREMLRFDVHLPAGQFGGQSGVLAALADRQRKLVFADQDLHAASGFIDLKGLQLRGRERIRNKTPDMRIPLDDVHLFVVQLAHDVLHPLPAQADAGAHRVHLFVARPDRQLGAEAGLTRDPFDFNRAIADFGDFQLKKLHDELRVGARENDLRSVRALFDRLDVTADAFADLVFLSRHALTVGEQRLEFAQVNRDVRTLETTDGATDDVAGPVLELGVNEFLFRAADVLHKRLLGVLRSDATEVGRSHLDFDFIAELSVGFEAPGVKERNLVMLGS